MLINNASTWNNINRKRGGAPSILNKWISCFRSLMVDAIMAAQAVDALGFAPPEAGLTFFFEDEANIHARARLDDVIGVLEVETQ